MNSEDGPPWQKRNTYDIKRGKISTELSVNLEEHGSFPSGLKNQIATHFDFYNS